MFTHPASPRSKLRRNALRASERVLWIRFAACLCTVASCCGQGIESGAHKRMSLSRLEGILCRILNANFRESPIRDDLKIRDSLSFELQRVGTSA